MFLICSHRVAADPLDREPEKEGKVNQMTRVANRTAPAPYAGEPGAVIRRQGSELEMVNLNWGLRPSDGAGRPFTTVRAERRTFPSHRCLLPASEFTLKHKKDRWRFTLADRDHFYFAGIWRPASRDWPESYAILTTEANEEVAPFRERQMAVILRRDRYAWLLHEVPEADLLRPPPAHTFRAEAEGAPRTLL
jgi:putative SOS response-associated peptidase YedK